MQLWKVFRISGGRVVNQTPRYSTSCLSYFVRVVPPVGLKMLIQECTTSPWTDVPMHHPVVDVGQPWPRTR